MKGTGSHTVRRATSALIVVLALASAAIFASSAAALTNGYSSAPSIISDKEDYSPGETVTLTGNNWKPGESVHIVINDDDGQAWSHTADVTATADGSITDQFQLPTFFVASYSVTATGPDSGTATTTFTDGNVTLHLAASEGVANMTVTYDRYDGSTNCTGTVALHTTLTVNSGGTGNIQGFGGNGKSVRLLSVTTTTAGKTFTKWTSGDKNTDSGTDIPGTPTPCISTDSGGSNGNITDGYAHFGNSNLAPVIASNNASVNVNEGQTAANTGTWSDANAGDTVTLSASVGTVTKSGTNASGTWSWSFATTDGPTQSQTVTITANDGQGGVTTTSFALGVSNVTPSVTAAANQNATEDAATSFNLGSFTDPGADSPWAVTVNWGDGSPNTTFNQTTTGTITAQSHTYANPGTFTVTVSVKDKDNATGSASFTVAVAANNHAPTANAGGPYSGNEGSAIQLDGSGSSDPDAGDTLTYAWSVNAGAPCSFSSATAQKPTITCTDNGSYMVSLTVTDNHGSSSAASSTALNVANVAPSATFTNTGPVNETQSFQLSLAGATDPSSADTAAGFQYAFDCGDGSGYGPFGASNARTCSTTDDGVRSVKGKVKDKDGGVNEYTGSVTVNNVAPTITSVTNNGPIDEGGSATITVTATDPAGAADPLSYEFDCNNDGIYEVGPQAGNSHACSFPQSGSRQVNVRVSDGDGGSATGSTTVTVTNVAPTISSVTNNGPIDEGGSATITVSASDPADPLSYEFDCNNDTTYEVGPQASNSHACPFDDDGARQVNVRVSDGDGGSATGSTTVTVNNVAPTATFSNDGPVDEGTAFHLTLSGANDVSNADTAAGFQYAFDCGSGSGYGAFGSSNTASCPTTDSGTRSVKGKIKDKDGGVSEYTGSVTVKNVAPSVTAPADQASNEGSSMSFDLGSFSDASGDSPWKVHVDWGDGSSSDPADKTATGSLGNASHAYDDNGAYTVSVKVTDKDGDSGQATFKANVGNVPPTATLGNDGPVDEGSPATVSFSAQHDPSNADTTAGFHYAFDCSNGSLAGATYANSGTGASKQCTFADNGTYTVRARIIDKDGGSSEYTTAVVVKNAPPKLTPPADDTGEEGSSKSFGLGAFSDAGANDNPWTLHITWGDGSAATDLTYNSTGALGMAPHAYADNGVYTVTETITDKDGGSDTQTFKVTIANVDPTADLGNNGPVDEGSPATVSFTNQHDPSSADTAAGFHYSYACNGDASTLAATYAAATDGASKQCTFNDNGTYPVKGRIFDKDNGHTDYTTNVVVKNVPPSLSGQTDQSSDEGSAKSFDLGSFSDPGADSPWKVHVDWGDGSSSDPADKTATGSLGNASHTYDDNGTYTVTVKVTDKDGDSGQATFKVAVANVPPTATLGNDGPVDEASPATISFSAQHDPSNADTTAGFHYAYACDNGSLAGATYAGSGTAASKQCTYGDNGTYTVRARIVDKDGGFSEYTTAVVVKNVPPTLTPPTDDTGDEGSTKSFGLGSFSDPGANDDPWKVHITWGDGSAATDLTYNSRGALGMAPHAYADNGTYTVTETITDKDGGSDTQTFKVEIKNVDPTVTAAADQPSNEGSAKSFDLGSFTDPGAKDYPWKVHVDWGDGSSSDPADKTATGSLGNASHTYDDNGSYTVKVTVTDKDGGSGSASFKVDVANVAPTGTLGNNGPVDEASPATVSFSGQHDPSGKDTAAGFHYTYACDGTEAALASNYAGATDGASKQCTFADNGTYTVRARIFDKDNGYSQYSTDVVVKNVPPTVTAAVDQSSDEGSSKSFDLGSFSDPGANDNPWAVDVDWGDGSAHYTTSKSATGSLGNASHNYDDNGSYTVKVTVTDKDGGSGSATFKVAVANVAPTADLGNNGPVDEGSPATISFSNQHDPSSADTAAGFHYSYACNGDAASLATTYAGATDGMSKQCTYADNGSYLVKGRIFDKNGGSSTYDTTVAVKNVKPSLTPPTDDNGVEGTSKSFGLGSFSDPGANDNPWSLHITWGDGSAATDLTYNSRGALGMAPHAYDDNGVYTVTETITDKDGASDTQTFKVTVANAKPTATLSNNGPVDEASPVTVSFSAQSDPSSADTAAGFHYAYDCDNGSLAGATYASSGTSASKQCTFADNGTKTVRARIIDKDDGYSEYTTSVTVKNVAPTVTAPSDQSSDEGASKSFDLGSFSDPGVNDSPWAVDVNWGDNTTHYTTSKSTTGSLGSASHTYVDNGVYTVTVKVTDKDGGSSSATFKVTVSNIAPTITSLNGTNSLSGVLVFAPTTFSGTFTDPGLVDNPWAAAWSWDGTLDPTAAQTYGASGTSTHNFSQTHQYTSASCSHTATVKITDKDGGYDTKTATVQVGTGAFLPPMTNQPVTNKLKNGQVLPVKVQLTDCSGAPLNGLSPAIRLMAGDQTSVPDDGAVTITPSSVSAADTTGVMRSSGSDGSYIYNMNVSIPLNTDYTVVIYPYGTTPPNNTQTLKHVIQATK